MRMILEFRGKTFAVESCQACPARKGPLCLVRNVKLRKPRRPDITFPSSGCPVHVEGSAAKGLPRSRFVRPKVSPNNRVVCSWCGNRVNPLTAVYVIGDPRDDKFHIYDSFKCLEQDLRSADL